jgi:hypothetical protein
MTIDPVQMDKDLRRRGEGQRFDLFAWFTLAALTAFSLYMFLWEFQRESSDLYKHALIASEFVFTDPHSITSRLAYPLWHLIVAALYQLGLPLGWAAALVCAASKAAAFALVRRYTVVMLKGRVAPALATLCALLLMLVTPIRIPGLNDWVYRGVGSPTVWHNPTQLIVLVTALLAVPYLVHCWYLFEDALPTRGARAVLPWRNVLTLAVLLMVSLSAKPTFIQALIPAAAAFFLIQWIRHPKNGRYFGQIILAFLPAVGYFVLQYLYYTGVVVPYTSGVAFGITLSGAWESVRNMLLMAAFPLCALLLARQKGAPPDRMVTLALWMAAFAVLQAMCFRETGVRVNHGNFNWANMSVAFLLWVVAMPRFIEAVRLYRERSADLAAQARAGVVPSGELAARAARLRLRSAGFLAATLLLVWHAYSSVYYLYHLLSTGNVF